jgi:lipooligosaccharide transport system permease protein
MKLPDLSGRLWAVWRRDFDVFRRLFIVNFALPMFEPLLYLVAMGFGLGTFVRNIGGIPYPKFIAPGLVSIAMMYAGFFECSYASFVRMYYQRTFDAIIATPVNVEEVVAGEILWGATRSAFNATMVFVVVAAFRLAPIWLLPIVSVMGFLVGIMFGSLGMIATAVVPSIDAFNFPFFLFITPMFLLCGTFFPLSALPRAIQIASWAVLPLTHVVNINRTLLIGHSNAPVLWSCLWIVVVGATTFFLALRLMRRRLIK